MKRTPVRAAACILLVFIAIGSAAATQVSLQDPIRLPEGQTLKAVYYFPHWWEPWKTDDSALVNDFKKMKEIGFNTVCLDHEVSQAIDRDFYWLDREYKLANQEKMCILPWLQLQAVDRTALMKFSHLTLMPAVSQDKKPVDDGIIYGDSEFKKALAHYVSVYLDRYGADPALLKIRDRDKVRPVVGLMLETGWRDPDGRPLSFDEDTNALFRRWMKASYYNLSELNRKWGTSYKSFDAIDPLDKTVFDYGFKDRANPPVPVREHMIFRARQIRDSLNEVAREVRKRHKNVLFVVEVAYPFDSDSPNADVYRWNDANDPLAVENADVVFVRMLSGPTYLQGSKDVTKALAGKRVVYAYRFSGDIQPSDPANLALDCAMHSVGFACYNWNEAADKTSAIYDKPDRQAAVKSLIGVYDALCDYDRTRDATLSAPGPRAVSPAPTLVTPPAPVTESAPAPTPETPPATVIAPVPAPVASPEPSPSPSPTLAPALAPSPSPAPTPAPAK